MNPTYKPCLPCSIYSKQRGVVLFIALVALVIMSLAAVALIRSVDTSTIIAGNLAFKQSATISSDSGLESAIGWLSTTTVDLTADSAANGYFATSAANARTLVDASANTALATGSGINGSGTDGSGNTIRYVIQRMCNGTGAAAVGTCLFGSTADEGCIRVGDPACSGDSILSPMYRVTARVNGPQNTISYTQAFIY